LALALALASTPVLVLLLGLGWVELARTAGKVCRARAAFEHGCKCDVHDVLTGVLVSIEHNTTLIALSETMPKSHRRLPRARVDNVEEGLAASHFGSEVNGGASSAIMNGYTTV
jgi:hypothetical protein